MKKDKSRITMFVIALVTALFIFASDKLLAIAGIFSPVFYGLIIAYLMDGLVRMLVKYTKIKRTPAIIAVIIFVLLLCAYAVCYTIPFLISTVGDLVAYLRQLIEQHNTGIYNIAKTVADYLNIDIDKIYRFDLSAVNKDVINVAKTALEGIYGFTAGTVTSIGSSVVIVFTSLVMAIYMLFEKDDLLARMKKLVRALCSEKNEKYILSRFTMANEVFKKFVIGKAVTSLIIGILLIIFFWIFGIEYAVVFGLLGGAANMIPYFGQIISSVPTVLILLIINPIHALIALIIIIVVQQIDNQIITPKVLSNNIGGVSAFWILFAVTICGIAFGFMGMIFGVPLVVVIKNLVEDFVDRRLKSRDGKTSETEISKTGDDDAEKEQPET